MKKIFLAAAIILPLSLTGCVISVGDDGDYRHHSDWEDREEKNRKSIARLEVDTKVTTIQSRMGIADFNELQRKGDDSFQVLFYRTHRRDGDGVTTKDECTPLVFKNGLLIGWGDAAYQAL
jgi:hypothetical protein